MTNKEAKGEWQTQYEAAYRAANGRFARVVSCGAGWYRIASDEAANTRYRKSEIVWMTAQLASRPSASSRAGGKE